MESRDDAGAEREGGRSSWSLWKLWTFALDGLTAFSNLPLRVWSYLGFVISLLAIAFGPREFGRGGGHQAQGTASAGSKSPLLCAIAGGTVRTH